MSILDKRTDRFVCLGCTILVLAFGAVSTLEAQTTFFPRLTLGAFYTNNVDYVGEEGPSDYGFRLGILLPVEKTWQRGRLTFSYEPTFSAFQDLSELNNVSQAMSLDLGQRLSRRSSIELVAGLVVTQDQSDADSLDESDFLLAPRTDRTRYWADFAYLGQISRLWDWRGSLGYSTWKYQDIEELEGFLPAELHDREVGRGSLDLSRALSTRTKTGLQYTYQRYDLEVGDVEESHSLNWTLGREITDRSTLAFFVGWFTRSREEPGPIEDESLSDGLQGRVEATRLFKKVSLRGTFGRLPTAGGYRFGTSVDSFAQLAVYSRTAYRWPWQTSIRWTYRDPTDGVQEAINAVAIGGYVEAPIYKNFGVRLRANYVRQSDREDSLNLLGGFGVVWYPLGRVRISN